ncbi:MAG: ABC transporter ATP-binding protein [Lachnospiraceae bacterium]|nr:ABC transporter ATP-binding protein [Lachnospiraceae bacterium]
MLTIKNLNKTYGRFRALNNVNLHIAKGELFGFVGANGAGKTTTMKICVGLLSSDSGEIYIDGKEVTRNSKELKEKVGYVPDFFGVYDNLTAIEYLRFFASTYGIRGEEAENLCSDLLELVNLTDKRDFEVDGLSRGMKQRLCLARALVHNPDLLFLDEPASGLDPKARFELKEILKNLCAMGKTIVISSHILPELAEMCTSVGIINKGEIKLTGSIEDIQKQAAYSTPVIVKVANGMEENAARIAKEIPATKNVEIHSDKLHITYEGGEAEEVELLKRLVMADIPVVTFYRQEGTLEQMFLQIMGEAEGEGVNQA